MPIHDWTRVFPGTFHDFHGSWITHLKEALNEGLLPPSYFALSEQHAHSIVPDILTLSFDSSAETTTAWTPADVSTDTVALTEAPPQVSFALELDEAAHYRMSRRTLVIRHRSSRRLVAMIEIVSPGNKDGQQPLRDFIDKAWAALEGGIHLVVIDLFPPGAFDPRGVPAAIWESHGGERAEFPSHKPLTLASYVAQKFPRAYVEPSALGDTLVALPLFLTRDRYLPLPLEQTYMQAYKGVPAFVQEIVEGRAAPEREL